MIFIGVDPGKSGAIAVLYPDNSLSVFDLHEFYDDSGAAHSSLNPIRINHWIQWKLKRQTDVRVCVEKPIFIGGYNIQTTMSMYESFGVLRCAFVNANIPFSDVLPKEWLRFYPEISRTRKRREKIESVIEAKKLFPRYAELFERTIVKGRGKGGVIPLDGRAEAVLIANYARAVTLR